MLPPAIRPPSAADKTLWGLWRIFSPRPPQEITQEATRAEQLASISGWIHVRGRWYWHQPSNTLSRCGKEFIDDFKRAAKAGEWDK